MQIKARRWENVTCKLRIEDNSPKVREDIHLIYEAHRTEYAIEVQNSADNGSVTPAAAPAQQPFASQQVPGSQPVLNTQYGPHHCTVTTQQEDSIGAVVDAQ